MTERYVIHDARAKWKLVRRGLWKHTFKPWRVVFYETPNEPPYWEGRIGVDSSSYGDTIVRADSPEECMSYLDSNGDNPPQNPEYTEENRNDGC